MPPLRLTSLLHATLPNLSATSRAVVSTLACRNGDAPPANEVATWVGLQSRYQLARLLRHDGLPPFEQLASWTRVLYWVQEAESTGASLLQLARRERLDPAAAYRLVRRTTGRRWSEVRRAGVAVIMLQLRGRCRARVAGAHFRVRAQPRRLAAVGDRVTVVPAPLPHSPAIVPSLRLMAQSVPGRPEEGIAVARVPVAGNPFDVAVTGANTAYVTCLHAAAVECLQLDPPRGLGSIHVGAVPTRVVSSPVGGRAYVTNQFSDEVGVIDLAQGRQTASITVPGNPLGAALAPDGRTLYVATNLDRLCAIWLAHGRVAATMAIPQACTHIATHPSGRSLYVSTWRTGAIVELDSQSLRTLRAFTVGGDVQDLVVSRDGVALYAANEKGWLDVIHLGTGSHAARLPLPSPAFGLALSRDDAILYVGLVAAGQVAVVDRRALRPLATLDTGGRPRLMTLGPADRSLVVANEEGWVDVVPDMTFGAHLLAGTSAPRVN